MIDLIDLHELWLILCAWQYPDHKSQIEAFDIAMSEWSYKYYAERRRKLLTALRMDRSQAWEQRSRCLHEARQGRSILRANGFYEYPWQMDLPGCEVPPSPPKKKSRRAGKPQAGGPFSATEAELFDEPLRTCRPSARRGHLWDFWLIRHRRFQESRRARQLLRRLGF